MSFDTFLQSNASGLDYPNIRPTLDLNFAKTKTLDPRITFTRASTGTYVGADGLIKTAVANEPRFDHDPATGESLGLLIEESRENLQTYSEDFTNWSTTNINVRSSSVFAPDGKTFANFLVPNTTNGAHLLTGVSSFNVATHSVTAFVKKEGSFSKVAFTSAYGSFNSSKNAVFDLSGTGSVFLPSDGGSSIVSLGNGWFKISAALSAGGGAVFLRITILPDNYVSGNPTTYNWSGDGISGMYIWGAQLEAGTFATSYIPTTTTSVTRASDVASITGTNFSSWYVPNKGTIFCSGDVIGEKNDTSNGAFFSFGTTANDTFISFMSYDNRYSVGILAPSSAQVSKYQNLTGMKLKMATSFEDSLTNNTSSSSAIDGTLYNQNQLNNYGISGTPSSVGGYDRFGIGRSIRIGTFYNSINGHISRLTYYPKRLTNQQLQLLTK